VPVEPVADDWEAAETAEEEKEKLTSDHNSGAEEDILTIEPSSAAGVESREGGVSSDAIGAPAAESMLEAETVVDST